MASANGTCVSFCNQPKAQFGYLRRVTPLCRCLHPFCGSRHLATSRESKAHFSLPGYTLGTIAVNVCTWMKRGFNAGQTHCSIFNRLPAIARYWSEIATFSYPLHLTPPLGVFPLEFQKKFGPRKLESWGYQAVRQFDDSLSRFDTIPACDGRTSIAYSYNNMRSIINTR